MFLFIVLTVFIAGLMVGRTPEYLGKKIEAHEVKLAMLSVLILTLCILGLQRPRPRSCRPGLASLDNKGPHGFSEILYAFTSGGRQQRLRVRRAERQHALLQHYARLRRCSSAASS